LSSNWTLQCFIFWIFIWFALSDCNLKRSRYWVCWDLEFQQDPVPIGFGSALMELGQVNNCLTWLLPKSNYFFFSKMSFLESFSWVILSEKSTNQNWSQHIKISLDKISLNRSVFFIRRLYRYCWIENIFKNCKIKFYKNYVVKFQTDIIYWRTVHESQIKNVLLLDGAQY
jgi:hypothetical protein